MDEVQKIAILDLRILNLDRNTGNILVQEVYDKDKRKKRKVLVPIDHGLSIPDNLEVCSFDLAWLSWDQATRPFSKNSKRFVESLNVMEDIEMLEKTFKFRSICLRNMRISNLLLIKGVQEGLTLA